MEKQQLIYLLLECLIEDLTNKEINEVMDSILDLKEKYIKNINTIQQE